MSSQKILETSSVADCARLKPIKPAVVRFYQALVYISVAIGSSKWDLLDPKHAGLSAESSRELLYVVAQSVGKI